MMDKHAQPTQPLNAGRPEYWEMVRRNTKLRNADSAVKEGLTQQRPSQVYETWLAERARIVHAAMDGLPIEDQSAFLAKWSTELGLPELMEHSLAALSENAAIARQEAVLLMYG